MFQQDSATHKTHDAIQRTMDIWLQERDQLAVKDLSVIILTHATATAQTDPVGWLWRTLARGELRHRRNGRRR